MARADRPAAQDLFAEDLYEAVSTGDPDQPSIHFSTKRDLFFEVVGNFAHVPEIADLASVDDSVAERVASVFRLWLDSVDRHRETFMAILHIAASQDAQWCVVRHLSRRCQCHDGRMNDASSLAADVATFLAAHPPETAERGEFLWVSVFDVDDQYDGDLEAAGSEERRSMPQRPGRTPVHSRPTLRVGLASTCSG